VAASVDAIVLVHHPVPVVGDANVTLPATAAVIEAHSGLVPVVLDVVARYVDVDEDVAVDVVAAGAALV
jgi:hypothetical protein